MTHHRSTGQVKKFDVFKVIVLIILLLLLLLLWIFRPFQSRKALTEAPPEQAVTDTPAAAADDQAATEAAQATAMAEEAAAETQATEPAQEEAAGAEAPPEIAAPTLDLPPGEVTAGEVTLSGSGEPGSEVEIVIDGQVVDTAKVGSDGTWTFSTDLTPGDHDIGVRNVDEAGNVLAESEVATLTVTEEAAAAEVAAPTLDLAEETVASGEVTLSGTGEPGSEVEIVIDGQVVGTAKVGSDGTWTFNADLTPGDHDIGVRNIDEAGNVLAESEAATLTVTEPAAEMAAPTLDLAEETVASGEVTLSGTGEPGSEVEIVIDGQVVGTAKVGSDGTWTFSTDLTPGDHDIGVRNVDEAGNVLAESEATTLTVTEAAEETAPPPSMTDGEAYIVQRGDWLSKLADKYYGDMFAYPVIVKATNAKAAEDSSFTVITDPHWIEVGQKLWIPKQ